MANSRLTALVNKLRPSEEQVLHFPDQDCQWNKPKDVSNVAQKIRKTKVVHCVNLRGKSLGPEAATVVAQAFRCHAEIHKISLRRVFRDLCSEDVVSSLHHLCEGLLAARIQLSAIDISTNHFDTKSVKALNDLLTSSVCCSLREIYAEECNLGPEGTTELAQAIAHSGLELQKMHYGNNQMRDEGAVAIAEVSYKMKSLVEVHLPNTLITIKGLKALAVAFAENTLLEVIDVSGNDFKDLGTYILIKALSRTPILRKLFLSNCSIGTEGCLALADFLRDHLPEIEVIDLSFNLIDKEGAFSLIHALGQKALLERIDLKGNPVCPVAYEDIVKQFQTALRPDALSEIASNSIDTENWETSEIARCIFDTTQYDEDFETPTERFCLHRKPCTLQMLKAIKAADKMAAFEKVFQMFKGDDYTLILCFTAMKCAHLSKDSVEAFYLGKMLFRKLMNHAIDTNQHDRIGNHLLRLLALLRSEEGFQILYNVEACRNVLKETLKEMKDHDAFIIRRLSSFLLPQ